MKKLSKLTLRNVDANDLMSDKEMKDVLGGGRPGYPAGGVFVDCVQATTCSGRCKSSESLSSSSFYGTCKQSFDPGYWGACTCIYDIVNK